MECDCGAKDGESCMTSCSLWTVEEEEPIPLSVLRVEMDVDDDEIFFADLLSEKVIEVYFDRMLARGVEMVQKANPNRSNAECEIEARRILHSILDKIS
jgi:hypothetical protein